MHMQVHIYYIYFYKQLEYNSVWLLDRTKKVVKRSVSVKYIQVSMCAGSTKMLSAFLVLFQRIRKIVDLFLMPKLPTP